MGRLTVHNRHRNRWADGDFTRYEVFERWRRLVSICIWKPKYNSMTVLRFQSTKQWTTKDFSNNDITSKKGNLNRKDRWGYLKAFHLSRPLLDVSFSRRIVPGKSNILYHYRRTMFNESRWKPHAHQILKVSDLENMFLLNAPLYIS